MSSRFAKGYAAVFAFIWIGYGLYAVVRGTPSSGLVLAFGIAFAVLIFAATRLSQWLMNKHYRAFDEKVSAALRRKADGKKA
ncbi:hypothetical protein [Numidum massiliense]|uniref:hypothetical protein n=1 Tax=Numidum massiliense TaxID=1522315 RepID=UPI0006D58E87|nr:hypothetical protein [Numidum massiliense]